MSEYGLRCWDKDGNITFDNHVRTIRRTQAIFIAAGTAGSIDVTDLIGGTASVTFTTAKSYPEVTFPSSFPVVEQMPYATVSGSTVSWEGGTADCYMYVLGYS